MNIMFTMILKFICSLYSTSKFCIHLHKKGKYGFLIKHTYIFALQ